MTGTTATEGTTEDWLGYGAYADALWGRIQTALIKSEGSHAVLGDDPLVIGVFGEWGAGKSKLLSLMQDRSRAWANERIGWRKRDGGNFGLTVPVYFQPWKYEHEQHLHVPILLHILAALKHELVAAQTWGEWVGGKVPHDITKHMEVVVSQFGKLLASAAVAMDLTLPLASRAGLTAAGFLAKILPKFRSKAPGVNPTDTLKYTDSGRYFYEIHEALKAVTRPKQHGDYLQGVNISKDLPINFVIFIDDLDRCLPEKSVQTLELIKTIFNAESFAFVLALDDEVIERGIGHRYKDYQLNGKKPEMPITGFEYLEKIIHLPFRLPALTREQAAAFVRKYESDIEPNAALRWFDKPAQAPTNVPTDLLDLALSGFDAFMPRKLIRLVELLHQVTAIARLRHKPLHLTYSGEVDVRVVLVLLLIQLFQPELFRVMRRRADSFPTLLAAFAVRPVLGASTTPEPPDLPNAQMADIDLWRWAVNPKDAALEWEPKPLEPLHSHAANCIAQAFKGKPDERTSRTSAQQVRLPIVLQLIEHRAAQRHVFDVLKLTKRLADEMSRTGSAPHELNFEAYRSLLAQPTVVEIGVGVSIETGESEAVTTSVSADSHQHYYAAGPTFSLNNIEELAQLLISPETEAQANMASRMELRTGHVLDDRSLANLVSLLNAKLTQGTAEDRQTKKVRTLNGVQYLAPFLSPEHGRTMWELVADCVDIHKPTDPKLRALWGDVRSALYADERFDPRHPYLMRQRYNGHSEKDEPIPGFVRIPAGTFKMGSDGDDINSLRDVRIENDFYICRTLVTVDQYAEFIRDGGYTDESRWWDKQGIDWRTGVFDSKVTAKTYQQHLARRAVDMRAQPMDWSEQKGYRSRPVSGVSWFEARAYSRWLNARLEPTKLANGLSAYEAMLPTEDQWERAARAATTTIADTRIRPWGNQNDSLEQRANLEDSIGSVCAVGLFPPSPLGLYDMVGNAWEWMDNLYNTKPNGFPRLPKDRNLASFEDIDKSDLPSLRGGSWIKLRGSAQCSSRIRLPPVFWYNYVGFRVVLSLAI